MHDTGLYDRFREDGIGRFGKTLEAIHHSDQDIGNTAIFKFVHHPKPELRSLRLLDPDAENFFRAVRENVQRDVHRLVANESLITDFDADRIEKDERIAHVQRATLPFGNRLQYSVGDSRYEIW
tara:strand:+ start:15647 stop:16018 length:372 start_codon:yes stop_codon:yes gene_type:complete